jgi:hypothetical protein
MPRDVTERILAEVKKGLPWNDVGLMTSCPIKEVESGRMRIVQAGDTTLHPIEAEYLKPEVHSLMAVDRPVIRARDVDRVVFWVSKSLRELSGTYAGAYIRWGAKQTFASKKSKAVPVPRRSTCAARPRWYDVAGSTVSDAFWPMAQQYRHVIPSNPEHLPCNHNLFYVEACGLTKLEAGILPAVLNATVLGLFKTYYGRYAGTEGNLKTEVVDVKLMHVPGVKGVSREIAGRIRQAFTSMQKRPTGRLVAEAFMDCHTVEHARELAARPVGLCEELRQEDRRQLDDAVLQMIGVESAAERKGLLDELYLETARHYRRVRLVEIQKQVQRAGGAQRKLTAEDIAASLWDSLDAQDQGPRLTDWLRQRGGNRTVVHIPDGRAKPLGNGHMFSSRAVSFTQGRSVHHEEYAGPEQAALAAMLANLDIRGPVEVPSDEKTCNLWRKEAQARLDAARTRFEQLAGARTGDESMQEGIMALLTKWLVHGRCGQPP